MHISGLLLHKTYMLQVWNGIRCLPLLHV